MSLGILTFTFFILLMPGIAFWAAYFRNSFSSNFFKLGFKEILFYTITPTIVVHLIIIPLFVFFTHLTWNSDVWAALISGTDDIESIKYAFTNIDNFHIPIFIYFITTILFGYGIGRLISFIVRRRGWDRDRNSFFYFKNDWHYIVTGEILDSESNENISIDIDFIYVDCLVDSSDGLIIYSGILREYYLDKEEGLDRICLSNVRRRFIKEEFKPNYSLKKQTNPNLGYYSLPGKLMVIPYRTVINFHFTYYAVEINENSELQVHPAGK